MNVGIISTGRRTQMVLDALYNAGFKCVAILCREESLKRANILKKQYGINNVYTKEEVNDLIREFNFKPTLYNLLKEE